MDINDNSASKETFKLVVVGRFYTGKTSFIRQYVHHLYSEHYKASLGVDFAHKEIKWSDDCTIDVQLWDISGQQKFTEMTRIYYQNSVGAIVVFDLTDNDSLNQTKKWKRDVDEKVRLSDGQPIPCLLVGNKSDLKTKIHHTDEELQHFSRRNGFIGYFSVSAKTKENIEESVDFIVKYIKNNNIKPEVVDGVSLASEVSTHDSSSCC